MADNIEIHRARDIDMKWVGSVMKDQGWAPYSLRDVWVAVCEDKPVGCGRAEFFREDNALATIAGLYVDPHKQKQGLGLQIAQKIIDAHPHVSKWHLAGHAWIEAYYNKIGFHKTKEVIPELQRDFDNQIFMTLAREVTI